MKRVSILFIIVCTIMGSVAPSSFVQAASGLKIGVGKVKITPEEPTILGGYSHGTDALCDPRTDILDDIYCRIMVAEDGSGNRELFLSMDVCVYMESDYYDAAKGPGVWWPKTVPSGTTQRFADAGGVGINRVFVSATHTHQASEQLAEKYIQRIVDGITNATNNMVAVNVGYANTSYDINVNRRPDFGVHPNLECNKSLVVAIFRNDSNNAPIASIVNYAIHNTGIGVGGNGWNKCSTELTGTAMNKIESNYGGGFVSLFFQGCEADVGPNFDGSSGASYNGVVSKGNTFGQDCTNILNSISVSNNTASVNGTTSSQTLATKSGWGVSLLGVNFAAARIGDICFIGGSGEIFNQMGISLRLQSPFGAIVTAALVNGYNGYVPTLSGFYDGIGGAEVTSFCPWTSSIENTYMTEMSKLVSSLAGGSSSLGYSSVGGKSESTIANTLIISKCNAGANMTLNNLKIYVQHATGKVRMGLYSDIGTDSPSLIQQTGEITLTNGWNEGAISSTNIGPGTYWIGFVFSNSGNIVYYDSRKLGSYSKSYIYGSLPSLPVGMNWGAGMYSIYSGSGGTTVPVTSVSVSPPLASIFVNYAQQLTATVSPSNAAIKTVSWSSGNTSVAKVDSTGLVTGVAAGSTAITGTTQDGGKTASSVITVSNSILVTGVSVSPTSASISVDATQQLTATVSPSNATNKNVSWSSDNTSVATVNSTGLVTGVAAGSATITVTTRDGGKTATSAITVTSVGSVIGLNTVGSISESGDNGYWIANSFTAISNITVDRMNLYVSNASGNARLGIYSSNSGEPGTLLAQTGEISLSNGWNSGILGSSQSLTSGVTYWLAFEVNSSATTLKYNTASGRQRYKAYLYGSLPSPAPVGCDSGTGIYSIYADNSGGSTMVTGVSVNPTLASISVDVTQQLTATVSPSNATNKNVSWSSDNTSVATVNSTGLVTGVAAGSATITVTTQDGGKTATSAITVTSVGSVIGLNTVGSISESGDNGYWIANSFTAISNITVDRMNLYVSNASGNARLGIYSSNSGEPGTLLAQTGEISLSNGWNSGILGSSQSLTSGVTYWLAFEVNSSATTLKYNTASGRQRYKAYLYGSLPSPAPIGCASGTGIYSIYADNSGGSTMVTGISVSPTTASILVNATQQLTATVSPSNATNKNVTWSSDNTSVATVNSTGLVRGVAGGSATITVTTQDGGKTATSVITVNQPPVVSVSSPVSGAVFTAPASVTITASATDADGTVTMVDFYQGSTLLGSDNTSPYSYTWTNVAAGNYTITAKATDNTGASTTSTPVTITVNQPPVVSVSSPVSGAVFTAPAFVTITASATDTDGTVTKVDFYQGSTLLGSDNTSPYSYTWTDVAAGSYTITAKATDNTGASTTSTPVTIVVESNQPPVVSISSPVSGAVFTAPASVTITASATDADGTIAKVDFYQGSTLLGSVNTSPYSYIWTNVAWGSYTLTAKATDNAGASTTSTPVTIVVVSNQPPVVSISSPVSGAVFTAPASVTITASATDADGTIAKVEFYQGSTLLGSDNTSPYSYTWTNVAAGNYTITAKATDNQGASTTSIPVTITVNQPPVVSILSPVSGAVFTAPASFTITASATDADGTIAKVDFYQGSTLLGSVNTSPYSYTWTNVAKGSYTITAKATDNQGASTTSTRVTIKVNQPPVVSILSPVSGAVFTAPASFTITASATDADGTIAKVEFYQGSTLLGSDNSRPYSYTWKNVAAGNYTITAKATDNRGASTTTTPVTINVVAPTKSLFLNNIKTAELEPTVNVETDNCEMMIPNGFSPNGDEINDYFKITCIENYPDAKLRIYSRNGALIYEQQHYGNLDFWGEEDTSWWDGRTGNNMNSGGNKLAPGSYIYILDLDKGRKDMIKSGVVFISW